MTTIYLSSTYEDLMEHRRVVFDALRKSGYEVIAMEDYVATDRRPVEECLKDIDERADIYIGIFAFRYGYMPPLDHVRECKYTAQHEDWQGLSITELEFRYAKEEACLPSLAFVVKEGTAWTLDYVDAYTERRKKNPGDRIDRLRKYLLQEKLASEFYSPYQLASLVQAAVAKHLKAADTESTERAPEITWDIKKEGSPYPGLLHFTRRFAPVFFGREAEVHDILERLSRREVRFILVSGDSGVGKSSVVDAGVLPRLGQSGLGGGHECLSVRMVPSHGSHPFDALMRALHAQVEQTSLDPFAVGEELYVTPANLPKRLEVIKTKAAGSSTLVLFLDQMEELFTGQAKGHADAFLSALLTATKNEVLWVIATIRSDHLHHCHNHPDLLQVLRGPGHYPLGPAHPTVMADMIKKPAQCAGLEIADKLVRRIAGETGSETGSLPLLAFVLERLFELRDGNTLSEKIYDNFGGVPGAVADHVKTVEKELRRKIGATIDDLLPKLFQTLLVVDPEGLPTRRRALVADFVDGLGLLVNELIKARMLSTEGEGADSTVSVAHEKLFEAWPALSHWIAENKDDLRVLRQAEIEAREWRTNRYDLAYLWHVDRIKKLKDIVRRLEGPRISEEVRFFAHPQEALVELLKTPTLSHQERPTVGLYLADLGDPRPGVGLREDELPDISWCQVPGGKISLEEEAGKFTVDPFYISNYPVTWIQYRSFLEAQDGYRNKDWWEGLAERKGEPGEQYRKLDNHPAENVSWYDAVAFCRWLAKRLGYEIRLPTEWEWQQAATGGDPNNKYPWGPDWDSNRANTEESDLSRTTAVGLYPHGAWPNGPMDMSGNVWEWCLNVHKNPSQVDIESKEPRSVRGGSWGYAQAYARCAYRFIPLPGRPGRLRRFSCVLRVPHLLNH
jgi:hypothetical protein